MFPSKDLGKTDYISLNIQESATFARGTSRSLWRQWNQLSRFQRNILYFVVITIILVIFYLLPGDNKNGVLDESDYSNIEVVQDTLKYEKGNRR